MIKDSFFVWFIIVGLCLLNLMAGIWYGSNYATCLQGYELMCVVPQE